MRAAGESAAAHVGWLNSGGGVEVPEKGDAAFSDFVVCQIKRAILRQCWLHVRFLVLRITG